VDPHHVLMWIRFLTYHPDADSYSDFFYADADSDPTFNPDADPDPDPSFQIKVLFHTFWLVICKLMQIRIQLITLMRIHNTYLDKKRSKFLE
jgi:hypothetical protein